MSSETISRCFLLSFYIGCFFLYLNFFYMDLALLDSWVFMIYESWSTRVNVVPATYDCVGFCIWPHFSGCVLVIKHFVLFVADSFFFFFFSFFFFYYFFFSSQNTRCGILMMCFLTSFLVFTDSIEVGLCMFSI